MATGLSFEAFAALIRVNRDTIYEWEKVHPEFAEAKKIASSANLLFWEKLGIDHIINESESFGDGISKSKSLNASIWIFNMKNRFKWRDKQPEESSDVTVNVNSMSDDELKEVIRKYVGDE